MKNKKAKIVLDDIVWELRSFLRTVEEVKIGKETTQTMFEASLMLIDDVVSILKKANYEQQTDEERKNCKTFKKRINYYKNNSLAVSD